MLPRFDLSASTSTLLFRLALPTLVLLEQAFSIIMKTSSSATDSKSRNVQE